jgi:catechol 2,3-dioxygenase-like lactoylglutathione lyase family enzyme
LSSATGQALEEEMACHIHHVHVFASNLDKSLRFYEEFFGGKVIVDAEFAGVRNVFMTIGAGKIHFYDQPPKHAGSGSIHHFGIQTDDIEGIVDRLKSQGIALRKPIADFGFWRYVMVPAPDDVLIELFEVKPDKIPEEYLDYFHW